MIDKSLRQHYDVPETKKIKGQLHKLSYITDKEAKLLQKSGGQKVMTPEGVPAYPPQGRSAQHGGQESSSTGSTSSGNTGGNGSHDRGGGQHRAAAAPKPAPTVTQTAAMEDIGSKDTIASLTSGPSPHGDRDANTQEQIKLNIQQMIAKQQEEKFGPGADPTKFGETISKLDVATSKKESDRTIDDKLAIEKWEKEQDYDKVKELADRGESFEDIQKAMDKGLLLKEDAIRRQGLIERGLAMIKPETKLESNLLGSLKKTFDPKRLATNFALKKMGLGWLNPVAGLASLFFPKQTAAFKSKFSRQPKDMSNFKNLGLYANKQPTDTTQQARVGQGTIGDKIVRGEVDLAKLITGNRRTTAAHGGRIDKPFTGRSRDI